MDLLTIIIVLACVGVGLYCFNRFVTFIDPTIKQIINVIVIIVVVLWLLRIFGILDRLSTVTV